MKNKNYSYLPEGTVKRLMRYDKIGWIALLALNLAVIIAMVLYTSHGINILPNWMTP